MNALKARIAEAIAGSRPLDRKALLVLVVVVVAAGVLISNIASPTAAAVVVDSKSASATAGSVISAIVSEPVIYAHVAGEVVHPGVYELDTGARVFDAIFAAGGLTAKAESASVNLARPLTDGEQIVIFRKGQTNLGTGALTGSPGSLSSVGAAGSIVNLNLASIDQLESLPGVGPALAGRMVDWRKANGGFKKKEDLLNVAGIGPKLFAGVKDLVTL